jgi:hypothetical protein
MSSRIIQHSKSILSFVESKVLASQRLPRAVLFTATFTGVISVVAWGLAIHPIAILASNQSSPVASVDQPTYDFGEVYEGEHLSHTFRVQNNGSVPLELRDPAARAENPAHDRNARVAVDFESGHDIYRLASPATLSDLTLAGRAQAAMAFDPLPAGRGRPAAPA